MIKNPEGKEVVLTFKSDLVDGPIVQITIEDSSSIQEKTIIALEQMVNMSMYKGQGEWGRYWQSILDILRVWKDGYNAGSKHRY